MSNKENEIVQVKDQAPPMVLNEEILGFEDGEQEDMIIPRVKAIQTLSPERKDKLAEEGDIINSLTKEKLNGKVFVPVFKFNSNIDWIDRTEGGGIACSSKDGKNGYTSDGTHLFCKQCGRNEFDNTKKGKDSYPKCTKYMNFFGFIAGERMPIVLSFSKTNYAEGKKLFSLAKVTMQSMFNHGYTLAAKIMAKNGNEWYNIDVKPAGITDADDIEFARGLYQNFRNQNLNIDDEEIKTDDSGLNANTKDKLDNVEY